MQGGQHLERRRQAEERKQRRVSLIGIIPVDDLADRYFLSRNRRGERGLPACQVTKGIEFGSRLLFSLTFQLTFAGCSLLASLTLYTLFFINNSAALAFARRGVRVSVTPERRFRSHLTVRGLFARDRAMPSWLFVTGSLSLALLLVGLV